MTLLKKDLSCRSAVRNIIFDFGGVICDLDISRTRDRFLQFGPPARGHEPTGEEADREFARLVLKFETGAISPEQFRDIIIRSHYLSAPSDKAVDEAWNALLTGIPERRIRLLERIRTHYRIFLLSNSNEIHYNHYLMDFRQVSGYDRFEELFEKAYFSFRLHLAKPDPAVFQRVLDENRLKPEETLFIDDTREHVETAEGLSINAYHLRSDKGEDITDLFE